MAEGEQRSGQLDGLVGEVAALRKAPPPSPSREITSRQSAAIDGALTRIAAVEAAVGELGAAAKRSAGTGLEARLGAVEAWTAAEAERAAARAKEATAAEEAAARREGSREKSRVAEMQASLDAAARAAAAAEAAASTATAAQAQAAAAQAHAEAQLLSLEQRVAEEVALRASAVDPLAEAAGPLAQLGQLTLRLGTVEETLAQLASAAAAAAAAAARAAKAEEQEDPWRRQTWAELREVSDKQRRAEARLLELGLLVSRCDALEARGVAAEARHTALGGALEVLDGAKADRHETAAALQARPEIARDRRLPIISPLSPYHLHTISLLAPYCVSTISLQTKLERHEWIAACEKDREKEKLRLSHRRAAPALPPDASPPPAESPSAMGGASGGRVALVSKLVTDDFGLLGDDGRIYHGSQTHSVVSARPMDTAAAAALAAAERAADSANPEHLAATSLATDLVAALRAQHGAAGACGGCCARSRPSSAAAASMKGAARPGSAASSKRASSRPGSAGRVVAANGRHSDPGGTSQIFARRASSRPSSALVRTSQTQMHSLPLQLLEL